MNRLSQASSPYLLQHRDNPVHWWPWGPEAFAEARRLNKPVLLSIGYAACHWCHVMAHESFEDPQVAAVMNELFVNIKVDREERPDVDHIYMAALQLLGQPGGWPLTMFLTPDGAPFWGGTYFPKQAGFGRLGFEQVLREVARVFHVEPDRVDKNRLALTASLRDLAAASAPAALGLAELDTVGQRLTALIDPVNGGLPGAPKFPNPPILEFLARYARRTSDVAARDRFLLSLERMALGGIHDHLGGGFARYAVDETWLVPHFEKMLYDNAQLLELYALAAAETGRALFRSAAEGIVAWLEREMMLPGGAFAASLDADQEGEEGRFYVWSLAEIREVLGPDADRFASAYDVRPEGNWEGATILNRLRSGEADPDTEARLAADRAKLLARREARVRPGLDDKVLADWNGLMIAALVRAGLLLNRPDWIGLAERAYRFVVDTLERDGILGHSWREGSLVHPGFALDHAAMIRAALALAEAGRDARTLDDARRWEAVLMQEYRVPESGMLAMTAASAASADPLVVRPQPTQDEAVPNANGVFAEDLVRIAALTGREHDRLSAEDMLTHLGGAAAAQPLAHTSILNALDLHLRGVAIVVASDPDGALTTAALRLAYVDRTVCARGVMAALDEGHPAKRMAGAGPAALVCAGMRCSLPVTTPEALQVEARAMLASSPAAPS